MPERNIFILTVDSLRADHFKDKANELSTLVGGVNFTEAVATASATAHSMPTLAAGVYGDAVEYGLEEPGIDDTTTLAEQLSEYGYECYLYSENPMFNAESNYDRGFNTGVASSSSPWQKQAQSLIQKIPSETVFNTAKWIYFNILKPGLSGVGVEENYYSPAHVFHQKVLDRLSTSSGGQMHWVHYMDVHHPFEPPKEYLTMKDFSQDYSRAAIAELSSSAIVENGSGISDDELGDIQIAYEA